MTKRLFQLVWPALLVGPVMAAAAGGWAVTTVEDLPDYVVAGQPVNLSFTVRQHGTTPVNRLNARVEATAAGADARADAAPAQAPGRYTATLTLPRPGDWTITIHNGFGGSRTTLLPVRAIAPGAEPPRALPEAERGRHLFVAKGCFTCHLHGDVNESGKVAVGSELTGRRYAPEFLARFLADPGSVASSRSGTVRMPNLGLKQTEIAALVAFINTERQALR